MYFNRNFVEHGNIELFSIEHMSVATNLTYLTSISEAAWYLFIILASIINKLLELLSNYEQHTDK